MEFRGDGASSVQAALFRAASPARHGCDISSLPKPTREEACLSVVRMLLCPEVSKAVGVPSASSAAELRLRIEIEGPRRPEGGS